MKYGKVWEWYPYLILVHNRTTGGGVFFSSRCTFFHQKRNKDCFQQSLLWEICTSLVMKACQIHQTKHQQATKKHLRKAKHQIRQKYTKYAKKTPTMPKKTPNMQKKNTKYSKILQIFIYAVLSRKNFVPNSRTFWCTFYRPKKYGGVPKRTNIRYALVGLFCSVRHNVVF